MSIEYVLDYACQPKDALTLPRLVRTLKTRWQAESVLALLRERGDTRAPEEIALSRVRHTPSGAQEQVPVTIREMLDESTALDPHAGHCANCPGNAGAVPFGCVGSINYPIGAGTEQWLLARFPDDIDSPAGQLLRRMVSDFKYTGGPFERMRADAMFLENRNPPVRSWSSARGSFVLDGNQALQLFFGVGHLQPSHCAVAAWFVGIVPHDTNALEHGYDGLRQSVTAAALPEPGTGQTGSLERFFRALRLAAAHDVQLLIDM